MDEVEVDIAQSPSLVLGLGLGKCVVFLVVVVPELSDNKDVLTLYKAFFDGSLDALACFMLVLVIICPVE